MSKIIVYTDGACSGNPGPGGWGALLCYGDKRREISGYVAYTTNNRMELLAAIEALACLKNKSEVIIHTDSQYLRQGITIWVANWKKNNWRTSQRKPVKNQDLWERLDGLVGGHVVTWKWVKAHSGIPENELVDALARAAIENNR